MFEALRRNLNLSPTVRKTEQSHAAPVQKSEQHQSATVPKDEYHTVDVRSAEHACSEYRTLMSGVRVEKKHVNGIDVEKLLKLYTLRPTKAAEQYLSGIKAKVDLLLQEQSAIATNHESLVKISKNISQVIQENSRRPALRLLADHDSAVSAS